MIPADPPLGEAPCKEAVEEMSPMGSESVMEGCASVSVSMGSSGRVSTVVGASDAAGAVKRAGVFEVATSDEGTAVDTGSELVGVWLVEGAEDTTATCEGTSTVASAAGGCSSAAVAGPEDARASGVTRAEDDIGTTLLVPVEDASAAASVVDVVGATVGCSAGWSADVAGLVEDGTGGGGGGGGGGASVVLVCVCGAS